MDKLAMSTTSTGDQFRRVSTRVRMLKSLSSQTNKTGSFRVTANRVGERQECAEQDDPETIKLATEKIRELFKNHNFSKIMEDRLIDNHLANAISLVKQGRPVTFHFLGEMALV